MKLCKLFICILLSILLFSACGSLSAPPMDHPNDLPDGTNAIELLTVESRFNSVYITGIALRYDMNTLYTSLSDRVYTFPLCGGDGNFIAYFWEPGAAGSSSRTQYYSANSFLSSYYNTAVKRGAFGPGECDFEFNDAGELTSLYQIADLSGWFPPPEPEPEIEPLIELKAPPDNPTILLLAENANLSAARDILLEPDTPPYNLGGWKADNKADWDFYLHEEGIYTIGVLYSRPYATTDVWGTVNLYSENGDEPITLEFRADPTSSVAHYWSFYHYMDTMSAKLEPGAYRLEIIPGTMQYPLLESHFINLRSVMLVLEPAQ